MRQCTCQLCGDPFIQYETLTPAKKCPRCKDILQKRNTIILKRRAIATFLYLKLTDLPLPWTQIKGWRKQDFASFKIEIKGKDLEKSGKGIGRIVIRSRFPFRKNEIVTARIMEAVYADRLSGKPTLRRYIVLDSRNPYKVSCPELRVFVHFGSFESIVDSSYWSIPIFSKSRKHPDQKIVILGITDESHQIIVSD